VGGGTQALLSLPPSPLAFQLFIKQVLASRQICTLLQFSVSQQPVKSVGTISSLPYIDVSGYEDHTHTQHTGTIALPRKGGERISGLWVRAKASDHHHHTHTHFHTIFTAFLNANMYNHTYAYYTAVLFFLFSNTTTPPAARDKGERKKAPVGPVYMCFLLCHQSSSVTCVGPPLLLVVIIISHWSHTTPKYIHIHTYIP
jgi:hypothetical protein